jgi:osmotically-inducible protein OsmY
MRALLFFLASITAGMAHAHSPAQPSEFAALDRNADGYLTRVELAAAPEIVRRFAQFDLDRDRQLSPAEYLAAREDEARRAQSDAALTERVKAALVTASGVHAKAISVETYEGRVQLSGFVPMADMASRAGRLVAGVSDVRTVHNNITVK